MGSELEAVACKLSRTERNHVELDEVDLTQQRLELGFVAKMTQREAIAGAAQLLERSMLRLVGERRPRQLEHDSLGREVSHQIRGQELGCDVDPGPAITHQ